MMYIVLVSDLMHKIIIMNEQNWALFEHVRALIAVCRENVIIIDCFQIIGKGEHRINTLFRLEVIKV